jgi:hypothetical protein
MVLEFTEVLVEDVVTVMRHWQGTGSAVSPCSIAASSVSLDQVDSINLTGAEIIVGNVIKGVAAPLADTKGISVTLHNFAVTIFQHSGGEFDQGTGAARQWLALLLGSRAQGIGFVVSPNHGSPLRCSHQQWLC